MDPKKLDELARWADEHDFSAEIEQAEPNFDAVENPMITTSLRLPRNVMEQLRAAADERGVKVTALMREWLEQRLAADDSGDDAFISVADVQRLIATKAHSAGELKASA